MLRLIAETVTDEIGIEPRELVQELRDGATMAEVIEANGGDVDAITQTIISNINNVIYGRINLPQTAKLVSETIGMEERELISKSESRALHDHGKYHLNQNYHVQEKYIAKPEEIMNLKKGEFMGRTTEEGQQYFWGKFRESAYRRMYHLNSFVDFQNERKGEIKDLSKVIEANSRRIKREVEEVVKGYKNVCF